MEYQNPKVLGACPPPARQDGGLTLCAKYASEVAASADMLTEKYAAKMNGLIMESLMSDSTGDSPMPTMAPLPDHIMSQLRMINRRINALSSAIDATDV